MNAREKMFPDLPDPFQSDTKLARPAHLAKSSNYKQDNS